MTNRTRNLSILGIVLVLLAAAAFVIEDKSTKLGLDLKGGVELVYQGQPTPQVPTVTPQALNDALETIRKRTDALGVSEPEIQRSGSDQISIGLPDVKNAERAIQQVGSTAQLQFYDWEPNVLGPRAGRPVRRLEGALRRRGVRPEAEAEGRADRRAAGAPTSRRSRRTSRTTALRLPATTCSDRTTTRSATTRSRCARATTSLPRAARASCPTTSPRAARRPSTRRTRRASPSWRRSAPAARPRARGCSRSRAAS